MKASEGSISGTARLHNETQSLFFGTLNGTCVSLDQVSGNIKWQYSFLDPVFSAPAILETGNVIIFASVSGKLACLNIESGEKVKISKTFLYQFFLFENIISCILVMDLYYKWKYIFSPGHCEKSRINIICK